MTSKADEKRSAHYSRASVKRKMEEVVGTTTVEYDLDDDGKNVFTVEHPFFRSKATKTALDELEDGDEEGTARAVLNWADDTAYDRFIAAGGEDEDISQLLVNLGLETNQAFANGRPTKR